jgi:Lrp/AsnC family transcriptional regulator, leucine-responsive regulatory protein
MDASSKTTKLLDQIGWKLLQELQLNGRLSYAELGRRVGLTTPAVVERVRRMEEAGIIRGFHADVDPIKLGMPITAFIRMSVVGDVFNKIVATVKSCPEVVECHRGTGADSFIMKVHVRSVEHLESLIDRLTPLGTTSTSIVLSTPVEKRAIMKSEETGLTLATVPRRKHAST